MGMRITTKLSDIGEGVAEAEIVEWHVKVGDHVAEDQILAAVMTDKATVEIPSVMAGRVVALGGEVGSVIAVGAMLVTIETDNGQKADAPAAPTTVEPAPVTAVEPPAAATETANEKPLAAPAVRGRARERGIDLRQIRGSGRGGRITDQDLDAAAAGRAPPPLSGQRRTGTEEIKVAGLRRKIAEKMAESTRRIAHFSYIEEIDVSALEDLRAHLNGRFSGSRPKLTILPFLIRALVASLPEFPGMNALYDDEQQVVTRHRAVHAGIATQTPGGLMVPVLHHAEACNLWDCAAEIQRLADAARDGKATRDELSGSTITITSLGSLGGIATTPVINRPEVAIIGVNRIAVRPVWQEDRFVPRKMMNLSSSFDHRVVDGHDAARFIARIKELIEIPATLFIPGIGPQ